MRGGWGEFVMLKHKQLVSSINSLFTPHLRSSAKQRGGINTTTRKKREILWKINDTRKKQRRENRQHHGETEKSYKTEPNRTEPNRTEPNRSHVYQINPFPPKQRVNT